MNNRNEAQPAQPISSDAQPIGWIRPEVAETLKDQRTASDVEAVVLRKGRGTFHTLAIYASPAPDVRPIDMILHCPKCGKQHVDEVESVLVWTGGAVKEPSHEEVTWENPPHRSHLCHGCGHIWRPADVPTNGVAAIKTKGKADSAAPDLRPSVPVSDEIAQKLNVIEKACELGGYIGMTRSVQELRALLASQPASVQGVSDERIADKLLENAHAIATLKEHSADKAKQFVRDIIEVASRPAVQGVSNEEMLRREIHNLKRHIEDYCQPAQAAPSEPDGWQLVPKELPDEMGEAWAAAEYTFTYQCEDHPGARYQRRHQYRALLAAAPSAPAQEKKQ
jgi:hypothetical protein